ncbi:MAG TPA: DUF1028 domain-containing protein [Acetobacteraceae bacterium]
MTFSIAGLCRRTGEFGCALTTSSMAAGARAAFVRPGVGVVLSQARSDPRLGALGLSRLAAHRQAPDVLKDMLASTPHAAWRQLAVLDLAGRTACATGAHCTDAKAESPGDGVVAVGNGLANASVVPAMADAFGAAADQPLAERLLRALEAGLEAGGEAYPLRSASLHIAWPDAPFLPIDLRVDFHPTPIAELRRFFSLWAPMAPAYVERCMDPEKSRPAADIEGHPSA